VPGLTLRARPAGDGTIELELAFDHPMESGERHDGQGTRIPPWYLTRVRLDVDDTRFADVTLGPAVARHPVLTIALGPEAGGSTLRAEWADNRGEGGVRTLRLDAAVPGPAVPPAGTAPAR